MSLEPYPSVHNSAMSKSPLGSARRSARGFLYTTNHLKRSKNQCVRQFFSGLQCIWVAGAVAGADFEGSRERFAARLYTTNHLKHSKNQCVRQFFSGFQCIWVAGPSGFRETEAKRGGLGWKKKREIAALKQPPRGLSAETVF